MTTRTLRIAAVGAVVAVAAALPLVSQAAPKAPVLAGTVGPDTNFSISLLDAKGAKVTKLKAGKYVFRISDSTAIHNFHLTGPGVNKDTGVGAKGTFTWNVTLKKGMYTYVCDPHKTIMKGSFTVA